VSSHLYDADGRFVGTCYTHGGPRVLVDGADGCQHEVCVKLRGLEFSGPVFGVVPGGHNDANSYRRKQEKGLQEYAAARKAGLQPRSTEPGSVAKLEQEMESQQRALKKLEAMGNDTSSLKVHKGVR